MKRFLTFWLVVWCGTPAMGEELKLDELSFVDRRQRNTVYTFASNNTPDFAITVQSRAVGKKSGFYKVSDVLVDGRCEILKYERKAAGANELTLRDRHLKRDFVLVLKTPKNWPEYFAEFKLAGAEESFFVREGDEFSLAGREGKFRVAEISETEVRIEDGKGASSTLQLAKEEES